MTKPLVSIILPTYNRDRFLPEAFAAIGAQTLRDWELIVVDDGSTDGTKAVCDDFGRVTDRLFSYCFQQNSGPAVARNTGIARASGELLAFFDSDDLWDPAYLEILTSALERNPEIDWVYSACRVEELYTGKVLIDNTFYEAGTPRPFLRLRARTIDGCAVIGDSSAISLALGAGLYCGFQNSIIRARALSKWHEPIVPVRIGEDTLTVVRALAAGVTLAYIDRPLVRYRVHDENTAGSASVLPLDRVVKNTEEYDKGYAFLSQELRSRPEVVRPLRRARGMRWFWTTGYAACWLHGHRREALPFFVLGLRCWPWSAAMWKTYLAARVRMLLNSGNASAQ